MEPNVSHRYKASTTGRAQVRRGRASALCLSVPLRFRPYFPSGALTSQLMATQTKDSTAVFMVFSQASSRRLAGIAKYHLWGWHSKLHACQHTMDAREKVGRRTQGHA